MIPHCAKIGTLSEVNKHIGANQYDKALIEINNVIDERPFHPEIGSDVRSMLFEPMTPLTEQRLSDACRDAIEAWEKRASVIDITVISEEEYNRYRVAIKFSINNSLIEEQIDVLLNRER